MTKNCIFCGKEFVPSSGNVSRGMGIYCSMECRSQHRHLKTTHVRECSECGNAYLVKRVSLSRFCSRECSMFTFHARRHKARHYRHNPIHDLTPEERCKKRALFAQSYRQSLKGKAAHRQDSMLRKMCGTSAIGEDEKQKFALYFASTRVLNGRCTRQEYGQKIRQIQQGETYAAYC